MRPHIAEMKTPWNKVVNQQCAERMIADACTLEDAQSEKKKV
jgi:hypothetical protein